jgi:hypothetical protein
MAKLKNKKVLAALAATLTVALCAASTFAWITTQDSKDNKLATNIQNGAVTLNEVFDNSPNGTPQNLTPGTDVTKQVTVTNTGDMYMLARVSFQELLTMLNQTPANSGKVAAVATAAPATDYATVTTNGPADSAHVTDPTQITLNSVKTAMTTAGTSAGNVIGSSPAAPLTAGSYIVPTNPAAFTSNGYTAMDMSTVKISNGTALVAAPAGLNILSSTVTGTDASGNPTSTTTYYAYYDTGKTDSTGAPIYQQVNLGDSGSVYVDSATGETDFYGVNGSAPTTTPVAAAVYGNVEYMWYNGTTTTNNTWGDGKTSTLNNPLTLVTPNVQTPAIASPLTGTIDGSYVDVKSTLNGDLILKMPMANLAGAADATTPTQFDFATSPTTYYGQPVWYYDATSGYFYWMQPLKGGTSTQELLDSFMLSTAAGGEFADMSYDLDVYMDSVQATPAAVTDTWSTAPSGLAAALCALVPASN